MNTRRAAREWALQFLFQRDFNRDELDHDLENFWIEHQTMEENETENTPKPSDRIKKFAEEIVRGVEHNGKSIDERLKQYAEHWDVHRMGAVDRNILRIALYEIFYRDDIPPVVSINEALEIAKDFSGQQSARFINGILDRSLQDAQRPIREAVQDKTKRKDS